MPSQDTFFKVKTGLGVGTDALYADASSKKVSIGKSEGTYQLDVVGEIRTESNLLVDNRIGVGTLGPLQQVDVRGNAIFSDRVGIGTTRPDQRFQVNYEEYKVVAITTTGDVGFGILNPQQRFHFVGSGSSTAVVSIGNSGFVGIGTLFAQQDFHLRSSTSGSDVVISNLGYVGVNTIIPEYHVDVNGDIRVVGLATITDAYIGISTIGFATITESYTGISTIGFSSITEAWVGISTIGFATITESFTGISTTLYADIVFAKIGIATITNEFVGISTIGIASISDAYIGIATVGIATITNEFVGISTIGIASISDAYIGIATVGIATISSEFVGLSTILTANIVEEIVGISTIGIASVGFATITNEYVGISTIETLLVTGITTTALLDVGIGATLAKFQSFGISSVTSNTGSFLKNIHPIVGINTTLPTRTLDVAGDLRIRGEIIDSNNNVGYAYSVLGSQALGVSGRFIDAANLLVRNKEFIAEEVVGFITSSSGPFGNIDGNDLSDLFDYGTVGVEVGRVKCKRDVGLIIDAIAFDISRGGNSGSVGAGLSYYVDGTLSHLDPNPAIVPPMPADYVKQATIAGISSIAFLSRYVVNNSPIPTSYQAGFSTITQLFDLEILPDGELNTNPNACANVVSAIYSCVGIITSIIGIGTEVAPKVNYPAGQVVWQPPGPRIGNEWFVNKLGNDFNGGTGPGDAFLTIKKACSVAESGDTIKVFAGLYVEDGPIEVPERVAVVGEDLRRTLVTTKDKTDLFHVRRGCYIAQMSFVGPSNPGSAMVSFPTRGLGYADGTEENWQSPYVQNCTNFVPDSIGMRIDGNRAGGFKSMVLDAYTQYNQGGIGVSLTNFGYSQLVSLFTICCDTAVSARSGGVTDLNNSNVSFGNYGLIADGATPLQYSGTITSVPNTDNVDSLTINVGVGASQAFKDSVTILRANKDFIASEVVGFVTSTSGPLGAGATYFDYGGSVNGREKCKRDSGLIVEAICSDILTLGNLNSIYAGSAYRDSDNGSITYLPETSPPPGTLVPGYVRDLEISAIEYIAGISTYIVRNLTIPTSYQTGIGSVSQVKVSGMTTSALIDPFIRSRAGIITSILGIGTEVIPQLELPKGQRPYDGQIAVIDSQYYFISRIEITNPGFGYDPTAAVEVTVDLPPNSDFFIPAEAAIFESNIGIGGTILGIDVLVSGTGYGESPPIVAIAPPPQIGPGIGTQATAVAVMEKYFFNPVSSTPVDETGNTTVTFDEFITYPVGLGSTVFFFQSSKVIASSITFEYVGTGINIVNAIPSKGAVPIDDNQIIATNGGKVPFTSTDQSGDFRISEGITINQNTGTITGQAFSKSLQAEVTPLIIALQQ
jgi:hypothetical protein